MATNLALDDKLIQEAQAAGRHKTKKEAVTSALQEYVARRKQGLQGSTTDFLICAVAAVEHLQTLTTDADFLRYAQHLPIQICRVKP